MLALAQSKWVKERIETRHPDVQVELVKITTKGDKVLDAPLAKIGGKGLFVKEIEDALLRKEVDLAVHSMKDVPAEMPDGLKLFAFPEREDPRDAFVSKDFEDISELPQGASVGTGSLRRSAQLLNRRPDLKIMLLRGNVDTRIRKLDSGEFHAVILACAGLGRLGFVDRITSAIPTDELLPAVGQGALGLETRQDDKETQEILKFLDHEQTAVTLKAERAFLKELGGGCQVPIAGYCRLLGNELIIQGLVAELDGSRIIKDEKKGPKQNAEEMGIQVARNLLESGAEKILDKIYGKQRD